MNERTAAKCLGICCLAVALAGCETLDPRIGSALKGLLSAAPVAELSLGHIVAGLKEALTVSTDRAVAVTSRKGGYLNNAGLRIPLPEKLQTMANALRKVGLGAQVDKLELKMNTAAELAAREAAPVFVDAIKTMTFDDARKILNGSDDAATQYFRARTSKTLEQRYLPIVTEQLEQVGGVALYRSLEARYNRLPLVPKASVTLDDYVTEKALDGLFSVLAVEEKKIRDDPVARTTELLRRVFGGAK